MGFQWVNDTHRYHDLPKPIIWKENMTVFTTSMTHQLHCLFAIVETYSGLTSNTTLPDDHHWHMYVLSQIFFLSEFFSTCSTTSFRFRSAEITLINFVIGSIVLTICDKPSYVRPIWLLRGWKQHSQIITEDLMGGIQSMVSPSGLR